MSFMSELKVDPPPKTCNCCFSVSLSFAFIFFCLVSCSYDLSIQNLHSSLLCMWFVCLCEPDNLSEVLLRLMRGDSIRLQIPLINLVRSTCLLHANEFLKCVTVSEAKENRAGMKEMRPESDKEPRLAQKRKGL